VVFAAWTVRVIRIRRMRFRAWFLVEAFVLPSSDVPVESSVSALSKYRNWKPVTFSATI